MRTIYWTALSFFDPTEHCIFAMFWRSRLWSTLLVCDGIVNVPAELFLGFASVWGRS